MGALLLQVAQEAQYLGMLIRVQHPPVEFAGSFFGAELFRLGLLLGHHIEQMAVKVAFPHDQGVSGFFMIAEVGENILYNIRRTRAQRVPGSGFKNIN
jgi:hypothetical protein